MEQALASETPYDRNPKCDDPTYPYAWQCYRGNKALQSVYRKGAVAAIEGKGLDAQPYGDHRTDRGGVTFSRAFQRAWAEGWHLGLYGKTNACKLTPYHDGECVLA